MGPSQKAIEAGAGAINLTPAKWVPTITNAVLEAAYPIIRADVIAEVVAKLRASATPDKCQPHVYEAFADFIEREFGGGA